MTIHNFIKKRPYLIWSSSNYKLLSEEAIVEAVLNYGNWVDVQGMIRILGIKKTALIFKKKSKQRRNNYRPDIKNYFKLYFKKYA